MSQLFHHTFAPWRVEGDSRIVATEVEWLEPLKWHQEAKDADLMRQVERWKDTSISKSERFRIELPIDLFEDWRGDIHQPDGEPAWLVHFRDGSAGWSTQTHFAPDPDNGQDRKLTMQDVRNRLFSLIEETPNLDWFITTATPEKVTRIMPPCRVVGGHHGDLCSGGRVQSPNAQFTQDCYQCRGTGLSIIPNLWLGVSISTQAEADKRIPHLLQCPAAKRWLDVVPGEMIDLSHGIGERFCIGCQSGVQWMGCVSDDESDDLDCEKCKSDTFGRFPDERAHFVRVRGTDKPIHPDWVRSLRDQCEAAGVPMWFDGWGEWLPGIGGMNCIGIGVFLPDGRFVDPYDLDAINAPEVDLDKLQYMNRVDSLFTNRQLDGVEITQLPGELA